MKHIQRISEVEAINIRQLPEGGFVVTVPADMPGYVTRDVVAVSSVEELTEWLSIALSNGDGFRVLA